MKMSECEKWHQAGLDARQPEIDALKAENNKFAESSAELLKENAALKAEVEKLRKGMEQVIAEIQATRHFRDLTTLESSIREGLRLSVKQIPAMKESK
jgi:phage shock protein A